MSEAAGLVPAALACGAQSRRAFENLGTVLRAAGASLADIVHWRIYVADGHPIEQGVAAFQEVWDAKMPPPAITVVVVSRFANPAFLVEIDAVAAL